MKQPARLLAAAAVLVTTISACSPRHQEPSIELVNAEVPASVRGDDVLALSITLSNSHGTAWQPITAAMTYDPSRADAVTHVQTALVQAASTATLHYEIELPRLAVRADTRNLHPRLAIELLGKRHSMDFHFGPIRVEPAAAPQHP